MAKLDGTVLFSALFTIVNELEQVRWQVFVPTKALEHIKGGFVGIVESLRTRGLPPPLIGYTDNVHADYATAVECIPSLKFNVSPTTKTASLPVAVLSRDVTTISSSTIAAIENVCSCILQIGPDGTTSPTAVVLGIRLQWEFTPDSNLARRATLLCIAIANVVHQFAVSVVLHFYLFWC